MQNEKTCATRIIPRSQRIFHIILAGMRERADHFASKAIQGLPVCAVLEEQCRHGSIARLVKPELSLGLHEHGDLSDSWTFYGARRESHRRGFSGVRSRLISQRSKSARL